MAQSISQYELIYKQFPDSYRAPEAKYRVGLIEWRYLKDHKKAKNTFSTLISDYPKTSWAQEATKAYGQMDQELLDARASAEEAMIKLEEKQKRNYNR